MCGWRTIRREKQKAAEAVFEKIQVRNLPVWGEITNDKFKKPTHI